MSFQEFVTKEFKAEALAVNPQKCEKCGGRLGAQDPGTLCGFCKFISRPR